MLELFIQEHRILGRDGEGTEILIQTLEVVPIQKEHNTDPQPERGAGVENAEDF